MILKSILIILAGIGAANAVVNEYIFAWFRERIPDWKPLQMLFDCLTCLSFWTTLALGLCFCCGWDSVLLALTSSLVARIITVWEGGKL